MLFGFLDAIRVAFDGPDNINGIDRLTVTSRFSIIQPLPISYTARIEALPGVKRVAHLNWFGGFYQDQKNFFANFAARLPEWLDISSEVILPEAQREAFLKTRTGAITGETLAQRFGWKVGDKIPLQSTIFPKKDGDFVWEFDLVGIYKASEAKLRGIEQLLVFHYDYFDEARSFGQGTVGWYVVEVKDPSQSDQIAQAIDKLFVNSPDETKTQSEQQFQREFAKQVGDIGLIVSAIVAAVFFTLLLLTGNTMAQAIRERIPELAVLKTIGFTNRSVLLLVLGESVLLLVLGGVVGLAITQVALPVVGDVSQGQFDLVMEGQTWLLGIVLTFVIGIIVGLPPALRAMRLRIVDAMVEH